MTAIVTKWWWVRHAPVTANNGLVYGQQDLPCDCGDLDSFEFLAKYLPNNGQLITSNLQRTTQTADAIISADKKNNSNLNLSKANIEEDFREQSFGDWQGLSYEEFNNIRDNIAHRYWLAPAFERAPNGESFVDLMARVVPAITKLTAQYAGRDIISVAHGGTIRAAIAFGLGIDAESALSFSIDNSSITRLDHISSASGDSWRINFLNSHHYQK